jgi:hypothetical protein
MYVHSIVGTGRYTTSTTNMYNKDVQTNGVRAHRGRLRLNKDVRDQGIHLKTNQIEKRLVLILLVLVFKHKTKI